jgi:sugar phosphate isomerase/epimerase
MPDFSCADYTFPLLSRTQSLQLLRLLDFKFIDIGLFERNASYSPSELMSAPDDFIRGVRGDLASTQLRPADLFLQIGAEPAQSSANDPDPNVRARNRQVFKQALELCTAIQCDHLTGLPGVDHGYAGTDLALAVEEALWRVRVCGEAGVVYSIEPHIGSICASVESTHRFLDRVEGLSLTLDYGHFVCAGEESSNVHSLLPFASHIHVRGGSLGRLQTSVADNIIDFEGMVSGLHNQGYAGKLALEYVWVNWQGCNLSDNLSETILLRSRLRNIAATLNWSSGEKRRNPPANCRQT